eukprot:364648-Chlamydomonas_euryale.AAC.5
MSIGMRLAMPSTFLAVHSLQLPVVLAQRFCRMLEMPGSWFSVWKPPDVRHSLCSTPQHALYLPLLPSFPPLLPSRSPPLPSCSPPLLSCLPPLLSCSPPLPSWSPPATGLPVTRRHVAACGRRSRPSTT